MFFKNKDYKRALAKYARVQCYTNILVPNKEGEMAMFTSMSKKAKVSYSANPLIKWLNRRNKINLKYL